MTHPDTSALILLVLAALSVAVFAVALWWKR